MWNNFHSNSVQTKRPYKEWMTLKHIPVCAVDEVSAAVVVTPPAPTGNNVRACKHSLPLFFPHFVQLLVRNMAAAYNKVIYSN